MCELILVHVLVHAYEVTHEYEFTLMRMLILVHELMHAYEHAHEDESIRMRMHVHEDD